MPTYEYRCENCKEEIEVFQNLSDEFLTKCEKCGKNELELLIGAPLGFVRGRINTIGQLAESNAKKLGRYEKDKVIPRKTEDEIKQADAKEKAKKLAKLTPERQEKYIMTGEL